MLHSLNYVTTDFLVFLLFIYTQQYQISILDGLKYLSVETPGSLNSYTKQPQNNHSLSLSLSLEWFMHIFSCARIRFMQICSIYLIFFP